MMRTASSQALNLPYRNDLEDHLATTQQVEPVVRRKRRKKGAAVALEPPSAGRHSMALRARRVAEQPSSEVDLVEVVVPVPSKSLKKRYRTPRQEPRATVPRIPTAVPAPPPPSARRKPPRQAVKALTPATKPVQNFTRGSRAPTAPRNAAGIKSEPIINWSHAYAYDTPVQDAARSPDPESEYPVAKHTRNRRRKPPTHIDTGTLFASTQAAARQRQRSPFDSPPQWLSQSTFSRTTITSASQRRSWTSNEHVNRPNAAYVRKCSPPSTSTPFASPYKLLGSQEYPISVASSDDEDAEESDFVEDGARLSDFFSKEEEGDLRSPERPRSQYTPTKRAASSRRSTTASTNSSTLPLALLRQERHQSQLTSFFDIARTSLHTCEVKGTSERISTRSFLVFSTTTARHIHTRLAQLRRDYAPNELPDAEHDFLTELELHLSLIVQAGNLAFERDDNSLELDMASADCLVRIRCASAMLG
ncbi:hypothetical protein BCV70DRAFT_10030 [Testicularia cyperi]|uniref:Uncharacterized protein n=1 Tax=Testicularia cyperi TaxID=1882483 RepID=A0A317XXK5_9BASI|nr:hypothetical protein BCV70DRAFT_10030 [Testicularia cyperi]